MRLIVAVSIVLVLVAACGSADSAVPIVVPAAATGDSSTAADVSLGSFFSDEASPGEPVSAEPVTPEPSGDAEPPASTEPQAAAADDRDVAEPQSQGSEPGDETPAQPPDAAIAAAPASVVLATRHIVSITGTGLTPGDELIVVGCQVPGDPIGEEVSAAALVGRVSDLDPAADCALDEAARAVVEVDGTPMLHDQLRRIERREDRILGQRGRGLLTTRVLGHRHGGRREQGQNQQAG